MRTRWIVLLGLALMIAGCRHTYGLDRPQPGQAIPSSARVYVALPEPGRFGATLYPESGRQTGEAIVRAFAPHVRSTQLGDRVEDAESARASARESECEYLVYPVIEHWEERATEWSGKPDRIAVFIRLYEVSSGRLTDASRVTGKSRWFTFGGDHPQELLEPGLEPYVEALFGGASS